MLTQFCFVLFFQERKHIELMQPYFEKRRKILKTVPEFWSRAFLNMPGMAMQLQHEMDQDAIKYLEDIWVVRDPVEPRCSTIEFVRSDDYYLSKYRGRLTLVFSFLASPSVQNSILNPTHTLMILS